MKALRDATTVLVLVLAALTIRITPAPRAADLISPPTMAAPAAASVAPAAEWIPPSTGAFEVAPPGPTRIVIRRVDSGVIVVRSVTLAEPAPAPRRDRRLG